MIFLQDWLKEYGYASDEDFDGVSQLTDMTQAVTKYQRFVGLPETGMMTYCVSDFIMQIMFWSISNILTIVETSNTMAL